MRVLFVTTLLVLSMLLASALSFASDVAGEQERAAVKGLGSLLEGSSFQKKIGISSKKSALESTIGTGFQIYTITPQQLKNSSSNSLADLVVATNLWEFLVMNRGQAKALIQVDVVDGGWKAVSLGSAGLAGELQKTAGAWPGSSGYGLRFIRVYQASCEFVEVSKAGAVVGIVPLISARVALGLGDSNNFDPAVVYDEKTVAARVREIVSGNIVSGKEGVRQEVHP